MNQVDKAKQFTELHTKGKPLILYNAWDAGSAGAIVKAGSQAIGTSSWAVAEAQGYRDGESIPFSFAIHIIAQIAATVSVPVTADFEGGYSDDDHTLAENISKLLDVGVVGINFEDQIVKGSGLYEIDRQVRRIAAIREEAERKGIPLFINARTDLFLGEREDYPQLVEEAVIRAKAYADAGASGFFIPGLQDNELVGHICEVVELPVNVMIMNPAQSIEELIKLGVSRISYGAIPYIKTMTALQQDAKKILI